MDGKLNLPSLHKELLALRDPQKALFLERFFKTGKGQYAEGDKFLGGIKTSDSRALSKKYQTLPLTDIKKLLQSKFHEERWVALGIFGIQFRKAAAKEKLSLYKFYLQNTRYVNNWDLVDGSAPNIVGNFILENPKEIKILDKLVKSKNLWERRIAVLSTLAFIRVNKFTKTLEIAEKLLNDKEALIHKAVGWMLREVGKKDRNLEEEFLKKYYQKMPRTMLRYSIEKFPETLRKKFMLK